MSERRRSCVSVPERVLRAASDNTHIFDHGSSDIFFSCSLPARPSSLRGKLRAGHRGDIGEGLLAEPSSFLLHISPLASPAGRFVPPLSLFRKAEHLKTVSAILASAAASCMEEQRCVPGMAPVDAHIAQGAIICFCARSPGSMDYYFFSLSFRIYVCRVLRTVLTPACLVYLC